MERMLVLPFIHSIGSAGPWGGLSRRTFSLLSLSLSLSLSLLYLYLSQFSFSPTFFSKTTNQLGRLHCGINSTTHLIRFNMPTAHAHVPPSVRPHHHSP